MERSTPMAAPPRMSPYQEKLPYLQPSLTASQRRGDTVNASAAVQYYYSPSPYASSAAATLHAVPQAESTMSTALRSSASTGPRMLAPPRAVQSIYASYAPPDRARGSDEDAEKLQAVNIANLKLLEQLDRANIVSKLPPAMYETDTKCYVQGFKKADGTLVVRRRATSKPVHFRECAADVSTLDVLVFHVEGAADVVVLDTCRRMRVMVDNALRQVVVLGCHDVEIVIGGIPPQVILVGSSNCCIATSQNDWLSEIETVGCSGISVLIAKGEPNEEMMHVKSILHAPDLERVLLPDALLTAVRKGTVATQCHYVDEGAVPPLLAPRGQEPTNAIRQEPKEAPEYAAVTHESSDFKIEYVSSICSVGLLLANDHLGTRVTDLERGPAQQNGRIKPGDYLMTVDGVDIRGYPVQEIHTLLMGPQGTTTTVGMCRLAENGALVEGYDVVLMRMPLVKQEQDQLDVPQELQTSESSRRQPVPVQEPPLQSMPLQQMPTAAAPVGTPPWTQPRHDPALTPTQPTEVKSWKWTPKAPTPGNLGGVPSSWKDRDTETEMVLRQTASPLPPANIIVHRSGMHSALSQSAASNISINTSAVGANGEVRSAGIGMAVQQGAMGLYAVSTVVPGGPADTSGQIKKGDIVHSVNGSVLAGKAPEAFKELVWGVAGSEVMLALLRPEAQPEDVFRELTDFEWWRPVILIRSLRTRPVPDGVGLPPPLPADLHLTQSGASVFGSAYRSSSSLPNNLKSLDGPGATRVSALQESFAQVAGRVTLDGTSGRHVSKDEGVGVALWLDEDLQAVAGTSGDEASFRARLTHDLASCLAVRPRQINVAGLQSGSVIAQIELHPCEDGRDDRSPMQLAGELLHQASAQDSRLRAFRATRRATMAKIMGPLSTLRPELQSAPLAMPSLAPSDPHVWQRSASPTTGWDPRESGSGSNVRGERATRASVESPYGSRMKLYATGDKPANGGRSLNSSTADFEKSRSFNGTALEPPGRRLLSGVLAGNEREAGVGLGLAEREGRIEVVSIVPGESAGESGEVFERNVLVSVDDLPLRQMSMEQVLSLVNGPAGSKVKVGLVRLAGSPGAMRDQDVMVSVELTRGENERVREQRREVEATEQLRREEWRKAQAERTDQLRKVAEREQERIMLQEQQEMAEMLREQKDPSAQKSAVRYTGPPRIVALTRKYDAARQRVGVGLSLTSVDPSGEILVAGMPQSGAAHESRQIVVGDVIHQVDNVEVKGKTVAEVVAMVRGDHGRAVVLLVQGTTLDKTALDPTINSRAMYSNTDQSLDTAGSEMMRVALLRQSASLSAMTPDNKAGQAQGGVGVGLGQTKDGVHFVNGLMKSGSAERSGQVEQGDRLVAIDDVHTTGRSADEVITLLRGPVGSTVVLTLARGPLPDNHASHSRFDTSLIEQPATGPALSALDHQAQLAHSLEQNLANVTPIPERDVDRVMDSRFDADDPRLGPRFDGERTAPIATPSVETPKVKHADRSLAELQLPIEDPPPRPYEEAERLPEPLQPPRATLALEDQFTEPRDLQLTQPADERGVVDRTGPISERVQEPAAFPGHAERSLDLNFEPETASQLPSIGAGEERVPSGVAPEQEWAPSKALDYAMQQGEYIGGAGGVPIELPPAASEQDVSDRWPSQAVNHAIELPVDTESLPDQAPTPPVSQPRSSGQPLPVSQSRSLALPVQDALADAPDSPASAADRSAMADNKQSTTPKRSERFAEPSQHTAPTPSERSPVAADAHERTAPTMSGQRLQIPSGSAPEREQTPPTPPQPVPDFHQPPTPPPSHGAGVTTPTVKDPRSTQTYNVRLVSGSELLSASPDPELITSTIACNMKVVAGNGMELANLGTVVEGDLDRNGFVKFRGVATDVTIHEDEVPFADVVVTVWDLSAGAKGVLGACRLPLASLPLGKDLKVNCPLEDPSVVPSEGWIGQASGLLHLRILSKEPEMGFRA